MIKNTEQTTHEKTLYRSRQYKSSLFSEKKRKGADFEAGEGLRCSKSGKYELQALNRKSVLNCRQRLTKVKIKTEQTGNGRARITAVPWSRQGKRGCEGSWLTNRCCCLPGHGAARGKTDTRVYPWLVALKPEEWNNDRK